MKHTLVKSLSLSVVAGMTLWGSSVYAANENIEVTPSQEITKQELAAIYVLSEICPSMVKDKAKFNQGYNQLVTEYLPGQKNPVERLNQMVKQSDFLNILAEAQSDAKKAGKKKNQAICNELVSYSK